MISLALQNACRGKHSVVLVASHSRAPREAHRETLIPCCHGPRDRGDRSSALPLLCSRSCSIFAFASSHHGTDRGHMGGFVRRDKGFVGSARLEGGWKKGHLFITLLAIQLKVEDGSNALTKYSRATYLAKARSDAAALLDLSPHPTTSGTPALPLSLYSFLSLFAPMLHKASLLTTDTTLIILTKIINSNTSPSTGSKGSFTTPHHPHCANCRKLGEKQWPTLQNQLVSAST